MAYKIQLRAAISVAILYVGVLFTITAIAAGAAQEQVVLKVVGPDGQPLAKAKVYQYYALHYNQQHGNEFICDENGVAELNEINLFKTRQPVSLYILYEDKFAGFTEVNPDDLGKELQVNLTTACRLAGTIKSTKLANLGQSLELTNVYVYRGQDRLMSCLNKNADYEFILPSGEYTLKVTGKRISDYFEDIYIDPGQKNSQFNFDISADRLADLIGRPAPELTQLKGWLDNNELKLSDLRGKVVLLDFFRTCCQNGAGPMPKLKNLYEKYNDKGLVIVAIHADSLNSVKDMEEKLYRINLDYWKDIEIPFAVALDGGGKCKIEGSTKSAEGATTAAYGVQSWPTMVLIDKQGKVIKEYDPQGNDIALLEKLLAAEVTNTP
jgi:thiol-disulfide isomerase/thioredoxin